jgi:hypothetical protein
VSARKTTIPGGRTLCPCGGRGLVLTAPGQPLPRDGAGLESVLAVGRMLYLEQAWPAQEGTYTCECSNVAGTSSQDQRLEVHGEQCQGWDRHG